MATVKTAISLRESLFEQAETLAAEMKVSRSQVFALALEAFIERRQSQKLLERLDEAYRDEDPVEERLRHHMRRRHQQLVEGEW
ncbi:MAG: hypothetical protein M3498_19100 [Deinococcota bacterium]|jgi:predicted transcriptional regulator|nr:hypothetical protein [Deinococcota bacterium]